MELGRHRRRVQGAVLVVDLLGGGQQQQDAPGEVGELGRQEPEAVQPVAVQLVAGGQTRERGQVQVALHQAVGEHGEIEKALVGLLVEGLEQGVEPPPPVGQQGGGRVLALGSVGPPRVPRLAQAPGDGHAAGVVQGEQVPGQRGVCRQDRGRAVLGPSAEGQVQCLGERAGQFPAYIVAQQGAVAGVGQLDGEALGLVAGDERRDPLPDPGGAVGVKVVAGPGREQQVGTGGQAVWGRQVVEYAAATGGGGGQGLRQLVEAVQTDQERVCRAEPDGSGGTGTQGADPVDEGLGAVGSGGREGRQALLAGVLAGQVEGIGQGLPQVIGEHLRAVAVFAADQERGDRHAAGAVGVRGAQGVVRALPGEPGAEADDECRLADMSGGGEPEDAAVAGGEEVA